MAESSSAHPERSIAAQGSRSAPARNSSFLDDFQPLIGWCQRQPVGALLAVGIIGVLIYFFGFYKVFVIGTQSTAEWAWRGWNSENDLEHGPLILPIALFIVWYHRAELAAAPKASSFFGMGLTLLGVITFVLAVRTLQPRIAIIAVPVLAYGITYYLWGRRTANLVLFPCAFLLFMVPANFIIHRTVGLQTLTAAIAVKLSNSFGIKVVADGITVEAVDGSFGFKVIGGCSGIRSLTAMTMLAALYVHFMQRDAWKKLLTFGLSLVFALFGNFIRIFSVILFARFISPKKALDLYHDYSGFVFFPIAVGAMVAFNNLLNRDWKHLAHDALRPAPPATLPPASDSASPVKTAGKNKPQSAQPASYDY